ncbi:MAG: monomeric [FeFe] hydrogenase [Gammaproteobacteria bacterium]|nr:monomeric [FeFe] hydrogenase [Gammaproteobacteria bacterium]
MPKFDTRVQKLRYDVLKAVAKHIYAKDLNEKFYEIPKEICPGPKPSFRCCIYHERAIVQERIKLATSFTRDDDINVIQVLPIACDECLLGGFTVSDACRGCIAHRCYEACPKKCITFDEHLHAHINKEMCINCGMCAKSCPYQAIENRVRPCERACKQKAISPDPITNAAHINDEKCIQCGACVYTCPFGAIVDVSYIKSIIQMIEDSKNNSEYKVFAIVAPSIGGNFTEYPNSKVISAIKELGFYDVAEAALGADIVALNETEELVERGKLTSSCCPAFKKYIQLFYPTLVDYISDSPSPMVAVAKLIKEKVPGSKTVFIGPCTAKKNEVKLEGVKEYVDSAMTFEELQALIDAKEIDVNALADSEYTEFGGSAFGRGFAKCGGLSDAVMEVIKEKNYDFEVKGFNADGMENVKKALDMFKKANNEFNFIEGMACTGGCIGGPCNLNHQVKNVIVLDKYKNVASKNINESVEKNA